MKPGPATDAPASDDAQFNQFHANGIRVPGSFLDHLTITAPTLEAGAGWVRETLGITLQTGGEHPRMGTHNLLARLGDTMFLEVISPNPAALAPGRPRWFALDTLHPESPAKLSAWVARTANIHSAAAHASEPVGAVESMQRGTLDWRMTIAADGMPPMGGAAPALIQWLSGPHPAEKLPDMGLSLLSLELLHPAPEQLKRLLDSLGFQGPVPVSIHAADVSALRATIATPHGIRTL